MSDKWRVTIARTVAGLFALATVLYLIAGFAGGWHGWLVAAVVFCPVAAAVALASARRRTPVPTHA